MKRVKRYCTTTCGAIAVSLLAACTTPYDTPAFDAGKDTVDATDPTVEFDGVLTNLTATSRTKVFVTHGMCSHSIGWITNTHKQLTAALQATLPQSEWNKTSALADSIAASAAATETPYWMNIPITTAAGTVDATYYVWSPVTSALKDRLAFDKPTDPDDDKAKFTYERARLNNLAKIGLMNDCLADAVIASGPAGEPLHKYMMGAMCGFLNGDFDDDSEKCSFSVTNPDPITDRVLISESLGSKILTEALWRLKPAPGDDQADEYNVRLSTIRQVFMQANQIPMLDLATATAPGQSPVAPPDAGYSTFKKLFDVLRGPDALAATPLQVVSFTDPNDILSYRIPDDYFKKQTGGKGKIINVIVSNDTTYLPFTKLEIERPDTAHCGYSANAKVMAMVAVGNHSDGRESWQSVAKRITPTEGPGC